MRRAAPPSPDQHVRKRYVVLGLAYGVALAAVVLAPLSPDPFWNFLHRRFGILWTERYEAALDVAANVILFVPVGFLLHGWWRAAGPPSRRTVVRALAGAAALAAALEALQWALGWRTAAARDVVTDTIAAALGVALQRLVRPASPAGGAGEPTRDS